MSITDETKRDSYEKILYNLSNRQEEIYIYLKMSAYSKVGLTASELAYMMHRDGYFPTSDRNFVHPRLNEMVELGMVEIIGKRQCEITNRKVSVYRVVSR
jgi:hypothetical protein